MSKNGENRIAAAAKKAAAKKDPVWLDPLKQAILERDELARTVAELRSRLETASKAFEQAEGIVKGVLRAHGVSQEEAQKALSGEAR